MPQYFRMLDKKAVKVIFKLGHRYKLSNEEYIERGRFVITTMSHCGYEVKCMYQDYIPFNNRFKPDWISMYNYHLQNPTSIKDTNPLLPRLPEETNSDYNTRLDKFFENHPEPQTIQINYQQF